MLDYYFMHFFSFLLCFFVIVAIFIFVLFVSFTFKAFKTEACFFSFINSPIWGTNLMLPYGF